MLKIGSRAAALAAVAVVGCAHGNSLTKGPDEEVLAHAVWYTMAAAPDASRYSVQVDGQAADSSLLARLRIPGELEPAGRELRTRAAAGQAAASAVLNVSHPVWRQRTGASPVTAKYAVVRVSYSVDGAAAVQCELWVSPVLDGKTWSIAVGDIPERAECWNRPSARIGPRGTAR